MTYHLVGYIAASLTTLSFAPQVIKIIIEKETRGLSLAMYLSFVSGVVLWIVYGYLDDNMPVLWCNIASFILAFPVLFLIIRAKLRRRS